MKTSIVLPAYNEEENLKNIIPKIYQILGNDIEILVIDDASCDQTVMTAQNLGAKVLSNPYNMGNGAAVKRGIRQAQGDIIVLMDADGQHQPQDIPRLLKHLPDFDMVVGSRIHSPQEWPRKLANKLYNLLASYVTGIKIMDLTSGFRAFKREKALKFVYLLPNTFSYPSTLTMAFIKAAYPVKFQSVDVLARKKGKSKINLINDGLRFLIIIMKISVFFSPLKIFLPISLMFSLIGLSYYLYTFILFHRFTNMSALLLTTGVLVFMLGLISEQIASLKMEKIDEAQK
jgi:glycosyltransferase involved in cell wall biosynthesis